MSTPGRSITTLRRSKRLRTCNVVRFLADELGADDLTQRDLQFLLDRVRDASLYEVDERVKERIPEIEYALACNCFERTNPFSSSNGNVLPFLNLLWPRMLANAVHAFKPSLKARVRMEPHDAMYKLLSEGADSFVQMLERQKRRSIVELEVDTCSYCRKIEIDEDDCDVLLDTRVVNHIETLEIDDDDETRRVRKLHVDGQLNEHLFWGIESTENFGRLSALKEFAVDSCRLSRFPKSVGMLQNLEMLSFYDNDIQSPIPDEIGNLKNLTKLILACNKITHLPTSIGNLKKLKHLNLSHNKELSSLPASIGNLKKLIFLNLSNTSISSLPDSIGNLEKLIFLNLSDTSISSLPASFGNLEKLKTLLIPNISGLKRLPADEFLNLSALHTVHVSGGSVLEDLGKLRGLKWLTIDGRETSYDFSSIECLQHVETLRFRGLTPEFDVRQLDVVRKLPKLNAFFPGLLGYDWRPRRALTPNDCQFIVELVRDTSICMTDWNLGERVPGLKYALACNHLKRQAPFFGSNKKTLPFLNKLWPRMLGNARHACKPEIKEHDAVYKLLSEGKGFFVQMLLSRSSSESK